MGWLAWFGVVGEGEVGVEEWDVRKVREESQKSWGGWHGLGWLGKGKWEVKRVQIGDDGRCYGCGEQLVCVDIDYGDDGRCYGCSGRSRGCTGVHNQDFGRYACLNHQ